VFQLTSTGQEAQTLVRSREAQAVVVCAGLSVEAGDFVKRRVGANFNVDPGLITETVPSVFCGGFARVALDRAPCSDVQGGDDGFAGELGVGGD